MTKFFFKFRKPIFGLFLTPILGPKKVFPKNWAVMHNFIRVSRIQFQEKKPDKWQKGRMDRSYFIRILPATTTRMAFRSRRYRVQCLSNQKLLHHSQHAKNQLKSYTHPANFRVSWSKWLNPFLTMPTQKSVKSVLSFLNLQQQTKNQFILSIHSWDTINFRITWPDWLHPLVWIYMNIQKIRLFH